METWKMIEGFENLYEVSDLGRVRSLCRVCNTNTVSKKSNARILKQEITIHGYCRVRLYAPNRKPKHYAVHRLVAQAFIGNVESDKEINHKNEIKTDNRACNLEICTSKENCNYGTRNQRLSVANTGKKMSIKNKKLLAQRSSKPVKQIGIDGEIMRVYSSIIQASKATGIEKSDISHCLSGNRKTAGGYRGESL